MGGEREAIGGMVGEDGLIVEWGITPAPFVVVYRIDVAMRMLAGQLLPEWVRHRVRNRDFEKGFDARPCEKLALNG